MDGLDSPLIENRFFTDGTCVTKEKANGTCSLLGNTLVLPFFSDLSFF